MRIDFLTPAALLEKGFYYAADTAKMIEAFTEIMTNGTEQRKIKVTRDGQIVEGAQFVMTAAKMAATGVIDQFSQVQCVEIG